MKKYSREWNEKIWNTLEKKTATDIIEELLIALASWKKCSNKDYKILEKIYYKLGGK